MTLVSLSVTWGQQYLIQMPLLKLNWSVTRDGFLNGPQDSQRPMFPVPKAWRVPGGLRKRGESQGVIPHPEKEQLQTPGVAQRRRGGRPSRCPVPRSLSINLGSLWSVDPHVSCLARLSADSRLRPGSPSSRIQSGKDVRLSLFCFSLGL